MLNMDFAGWSLADHLRGVLLSTTLRGIIHIINDAERDLEDSPPEDGQRRGYHNIYNINHTT